MPAWLVRFSAWWRQVAVPITWLAVGLCLLVTVLGAMQGRLSTVVCAGAGATVFAISALRSRAAARKPLP